MTALQLNAELYRNLDIIAEDETMLDKVAKYVRKLAKQMTEDPTRMSKEEYFAMINQRKEEYAQGKYHTFTSVEDLDKHIRSHNNINKAKAKALRKNNI